MTELYDLLIGKICLIILDKHMIIWLFGQSGSGKTTLAHAIKPYYDAIVLDGDEMRATINRDLGFSLEDRRENNLRIARLAGLLHDQGCDVVVSVITPAEDVREEVREMIDPLFIWVHNPDKKEEKDRPFDEPHDDECYELITGKKDTVSLTVKSLLEIINDYYER